MVKTPTDKIGLTKRHNSEYCSSVFIVIIMEQADALTHKTESCNIDVKVECN